MTTASGTWGLVYALWDLVTWFPLFRGYVSMAESVIVEHVAVLGPLTRPWWSNWKGPTNLRRRGFDIKGKPVDSVEYPDLATRFKQVAQAH